MFSTLTSLLGKCQLPLSKMLGGSTVILLLFFPSLLRAACPDLSSYYPGAEPDWLAVEQRINLFLPQCLDNSEYFALQGAAQLNSGKLAAALESLERALLLDPANGAASVDYAEAMHQQGELFTAIEINRQLLQRRDIPAQLQTALQQRQQRWLASTRQNELYLDLLAGYDDNLNGAPDQDQLTLTLAGQPIDLALSEELLAVSGPYLNMRFSGRHRRVEADREHQFSGELRGRGSEDSGSDLLQLSSEYTFTKPSRNKNWQMSTSLNHLVFGDNALFTGSSMSFRFQPGKSDTCRPHYNAALQHQRFHQQNRLDAREARVGVGINCLLGRPNKRTAVDFRQYMGIEIAGLRNTALDSSRLGGDRTGWQVSMNWQLLQSDRSWSAQVNHTATNDENPYSILLDNGAERRLGRSYLLLQYRQNIGFLWDDTSFVVNLYHQQQKSNIELFRTTDSSLELGIRLEF